MSDDFLRKALHGELDSHTPDRTAMLNRIAANRATPANPATAANRATSAGRATTNRVTAGRATANRATAGRATANRATAGGAIASRPRGRLLQLAGAGLGVLVVLGLGGVARWALADDAKPPVVASAPSPSEVATATPSRPVTTGPRTPTGTTQPGEPAATTAGANNEPNNEPTAPTSSASPVRGHPGDTQVEKGSLWSDGSIPAKGRSEVTLKPGADLTELDLTIRVTLTSANLSSASFVSPDENITATVTKEPGALLYHFVMRAGATLKSGTYVFAAEYTAADRDAAGDTYESYVTSVERKRIHVYGNFAAKKE